MLYLYGALLFFKNFLDYEKLGVRMQILKRHKLTPPPPIPKCRSDFFCSKIDLRFFFWFHYKVYNLFMLVVYVLFFASQGICSNICSTDVKIAKTS